MSRAAHAAVAAVMALACLGAMRLWTSYGAVIWLAGFAGWCG